MLLFSALNPVLRRNAAGRRENVETLFLDASFIGNQTLLLKSCVTLPFTIVFFPFLTRANVHVSEIPARVAQAIAKKSRMPCTCKNLKYAIHMSTVKYIFIDGSHPSTLK